MEIGIIVLVSISFAINSIIAISYFIKIRFFKFFGNKYIPIVLSFLLCFAFALMANYYPAPGEFSKLNPFVIFASSIFDALKMIAVAFERGPINDYFATNNPVLITFGVAYILTSIFALIWISISVIVIFLKSLRVLTITGARRRSRTKDAYYVFSDPKVTIAEKLGKSLRETGNAVTMVLTRGSQKTQEGTEYKDRLIGQGFEVRTEHYTVGLAKILFGMHFNRRFRLLKHRIYKRYGDHRIYVFGLFTEEEDSLTLAGIFKTAVEGNRYIKRIKYKIAYNKVLKLIKEEKELKPENTNFIWDLIKNNSKLRVKSFEQDKQACIALFKSYEKKYAIHDYEIAALKSFKVYLTYHDTDMDLNNHYSDSTLHIVNTLSEYDMISSEFILNNPITKFIDVKELAMSRTDNTNMHVSFFGLGKINRPILKKMTYAYQLSKDNKDKITYHIVDMNSKDLVRSFENDFTNPKTSDPLIYHVVPECDGENINSYLAIEEHIKNALKDKTRFANDGFEVFVVSLADTSTDINIALLLRKAIFKHITDLDRLRRTVIYVRISSLEVANNFVNSNSNFALRQSQFTDGYLKLNHKEKELVPVVVFGENALMSSYLDNHYKVLEKIGVAAVKAYDPKLSDQEAEIYTIGGQTVTSSSTLSSGTYVIKTTTGSHKVIVK